jgi:hypothetical protein
MKKVKKFGRGGDIITGIGAALVGKALYDKASSKDEKDTEKNLKTITAPPSAAKEKESPKASVKDERFSAKSEEPLEPEKSKSYKAEPATTSAKPAAQKTTTDVAPSGTKTSSTKTSSVAKASQNEAFPKKSVVSKSYVEPDMPKEVKAAADKPASTDVPKGIDLKTGNKTEYGTDTTSVFQKKAAQERAAMEAKKAKAADKPESSSSAPKNTFLTKERSDAAAKSMKKGFDMGLFERGDLGIGKKKGGEVKKYAKGGSVSSASSRGDGCAMRGKTKGRMV